MDRENMCAYIHMYAYTHVSWSSILSEKKSKSSYLWPGEFGGIMLSSEISQAEKNKYHMSLLISRIEKGTTITNL